MPRWTTLLRPTLRERADGAPSVRATTANGQAARGSCGRCRIARSRNAGPASLSVSTPEQSDAHARPRDPRGNEGERREAAPDRPFAGSSTTTTVSALSRGRAVGEATTWPQAGFGHAHADATGGASRCPLTARLPAGQLRRLSQGPHSRGDRRLLPREPGLIAGTRAPVSPARRTRWCGSARNPLAVSATTERWRRAGPFCNGPIGTRSHGTTSTTASRSRMPLSCHSTAACAASCRTRNSSTPRTMPGENGPSGAPATLPSGRTPDAALSAGRLGNSTAPRPRACPTPPVRQPIPSPQTLPMTGGPAGGRPSPMADTRERIRAWQHDGNHRRRHPGPGNIPPVEFVARMGLAMRAAMPQKSTCGLSVNSQQSRLPVTPCSVPWPAAPMIRR